MATLASPAPSLAAAASASGCGALRRPCPSTSLPFRRRWRPTLAASTSSSPAPAGDEDERKEVDRAVGMDGRIPGSSGEFVRRVSSRAYDMRRNLLRSLESLSYDVLETNPWREDSKPVYVLARTDNLLWTMKTRRSQSEVEKELSMLFAKGGHLVSGKSKYSSSKFSMAVEDIREGVLVFEDEDDAVKYCNLLQGGGQGCEGIAELEASSVFTICQKMKALAVLFRRGRIPPLPQSLEHDLRAKKRSLED